MKYRLTFLPSKSGCIERSATTQSQHARGWKSAVVRDGRAHTYICSTYADRVFVLEPKRSFVCIEDEQGYGRNEEKRNGEGGVEVGLSPPLIVHLDDVLFTEYMNSQAQLASFRFIYSMLKPCCLCTCNIK